MTKSITPTVTESLVKNVTWQLRSTEKLLHFTIDILCNTQKIKKSQPSHSRTAQVSTNKMFFIERRRDILQVLDMSLYAIPQLLTVKESRYLGTFTITTLKPIPKVKIYNFHCYANKYITTKKLPVLTHKP